MNGIFLKIPISAENIYGIMIMNIDDEELSYKIKSKYAQQPFSDLANDAGFIDWLSIVDNQDFLIVDGKRL